MDTHRVPVFVGRCTACNHTVSFLHSQQSASFFHAKVHGDLLALQHNPYSLQRLTAAPIHPSPLTQLLLRLGRRVLECRLKHVIVCVRPQKLAKEPVGWYTQLALDRCVEAVVQKASANAAR